MTDFDLARFRTELILQLPDTAWSEEDGPAGEFQHVDPEYNPEALAEWVLEQVALAQMTPDDQLGRVVEMAGAASTLKASAEFARYIAQLAAVLRRGHTLASQHDLARTIELESSRLQSLCAQLLEGYPELLAVETPERALVIPGQNG